MSALPAELSTGMVHGRFIVALVDGDDADQEPEVIPATGRVSFKASVGYVPVPVTAEGPVTVMKGPIVGVLDDEGYLSTPHPTTGEPMYRGVKLLATDDPDMAVKDWTWTADYRFDSVNATTMQIPAHSFALPGGAVVDLTTMVKVPSSPGYGLPQAEAAVLRAEAAAVESGESAAQAELIAQSVRDDADAGLFKGDPGKDGAPGNATLRVDTSAGKRVFISDGTTEHMINGDTGLRDITALATGVTSGKIYVQRENSLVTLTFDTVLMGGATGANYIMIPTGGIPSGFRPPFTFWFNNVDGPPAKRRMGITATGALVVYLTPLPDDRYTGTIVWRTTNTWPNSLPGIPA